MRVALIAPYEWIGVSSPLINTLDWLHENNYKVTLYTDINATKPHGSWPALNLKNSCTNKILFPSRLGKLLRRLLGGPAPMLKCHKSSNVLFWIRFSLFQPRFKFIIAYDPDGLDRAALVQRIWKSPIIYHSLEILPNEDQFKQIERKNCNHISLCLTQDQVRADLLSDLNKIDKRMIFILPNSSRRWVYTNQPNYFRSKFNISPNQKILLVTGSLKADHGISEILNAIPSIPLNWVLLVHGWADESTKRQLVQKHNQYLTRLILSFDVLPSDQKHRIFRSVDAGCVVFTGLSHNYQYAAGSAGKLYDFMQAGKPMLGNPIPGMRDLLEANGCGIVRDLDENFFDSLSVIEAHYDIFSKNASVAFGKYEFDRRMKAFEELALTF